MGRGTIQGNAETLGYPGEGRKSQVSVAPHRNVSTVATWSHALEATGSDLFAACFGGLNAQGSDWVRRDRPSREE